MGANTCVQEGYSKTVLVSAIVLMYCDHIQTTSVSRSLTHMWSGRLAVFRLASSSTLSSRYSASPTGAQAGMRAWGIRSALLHFLPPTCTYVLSEPCLTYRHTSSGKYDVVLLLLCVFPFCAQLPVFRLYTGQAQQYKHTLTLLDERVMSANTCTGTTCKRGPMNAACACREGCCCRGREMAAYA